MIIAAEKKVYENAKKALEARDNTMNSEALVPREIVRVLNRMADFEFDHKKIKSISFNDPKTDWTLQSNAQHLSDYFRALADYLEENSKQTTLSSIFF